MIPVTQISEPIKSSNQFGLKLNPVDHTSVFCPEPAQRTSNRYSFVSTYKLANMFASLGWFPVEYQGLKNGRATGLHTLTFENPSVNASFNSKGISPRIIIVNSHDGRSSLKIMSGLMRLACLNGLVIGPVTSEDRFTHINLTIEELRSIVNGIISEFTGSIVDTVQAAQSITRFPSEFLARRMWAERNRNNKPCTFSSEKVTNILQPRRLEDKKGDLWTVFNVIQENLIRGGVTVNNKTVKEITSPQRLVELNRSFWEILEEEIRYNS